MSKHFDDMARHQHFIERYKTNQTNQLNKFIAAIEADLYKQLGGSNTIRGEIRIKSILNNIYTTSLDELKQFTNSFTEQLELFGNTQADFVASSLTAENSVTVS